MLSKHTVSSSHGLFSSRLELWNARLTEFLDSPIFGCGFASEAIVRSFGAISTGVIEPGTSWGAIFAQIGLLGALPIVVLWGKCFYMISRYHDEMALIITSTLIYLAIHMCTEGYYMAAGNALCFIAWLSLGTAYSYKN